MRPRRSRRSHRQILILFLLAWFALVSVPVLAFVQPATSSAIAQADNTLQLAIQGKRLYEAGQFDSALRVWQQAADAYARRSDRVGLTQTLIDMAEALQALGLYPRACNTLLQALRITDTNCQQLTRENENRQSRQDSLLKTLAAQPNSLNQATGLRSLGDALQKLDALDLSRKILQLSLKVAKELPSPQNENATLLSLGNTERALGNKARSRQDNFSKPKLTPLDCTRISSKGVAAKYYQQAANFYQQAATASASPTTQVQAQLNRLSLLIENDAAQDTQDLLSRIQPQLESLPVDRAAVYARISFAQSLACLKVMETTERSHTEYSHPDSRLPTASDIAQLLATAIHQARSLGDRQAESQALGYLGWLYAQNQAQSNALELTQQALILAQASKALDITYKWQWQLGYLLRTKGDLKGAIAAYTDAVNTLQSLRRDLASVTETQFLFLESVEPVYRQLVDLFLQSEPTNQQKLKQARNSIEALQLAELENLLQCDLQTAKLASIEQAFDPTAAIVYPIVLDDRIEVILSLYKQPLRHYSQPLSQQENIVDLIDRLREYLQQLDSTGTGFLKLSQQIYRWVIEPVEGELEKHGIKTLVFVLDSSLRNIPMAALYDGQKYLIEKYAIAISPSLQLLQPQPLPGAKREVLAAGIFQNLPGFPALPEVKDELDLISKLPKSIVLQNQEFTRRNLENQINSRPFSIVHLATHGQFSSNPNETYIRAWDDRITINQLKALLQTRGQSRADAIELLVLSACETAQGDKRAALGLAGVAVRAGARSTLATLWQVNDRSTAELMAQFYTTLSNPANSKVTKAQALQNAQLKLLHRYKSPFYWAAYILVGNWL